MFQFLINTSLSKVTFVEFTTDFVQIQIQKPPKQTDFYSLRFLVETEWNNFYSIVSSLKTLPTGCL